jgi:hypothetical protein
MKMQALKALLKARLPRSYTLYLQGREHFAAHIFTKIYRTNHWGDRWSVSGPASSLLATERIREPIQRLIQDLELGTILDIPCGDHMWMSQVNLGSCSYVGGDIVDELLEKTSQRYRGSGKQFVALDITKGRLPKADLVLNRDCLVHFSFRAIGRALRNIKSSGSKYLLTTTYPNLVTNEDIRTGSWRPLNLTAAPFHFPEPILLIRDDYEDPRDWEGQNRDKSLGLWPVDGLPPQDF